MEMVRLGRSDLKVSRICMGCMGFGDASRGMHSWTLDEAASQTLLERALELGVNFFDTAVGYQGGTSEEYLGRALRGSIRRGAVRREDVVVATKFPARTREEAESGVTGQQHVKNLLDLSLKHLGMDYVDLYICHMWDAGTPIEEIMEGLHEAVRAGKVRAVGISNCFAWQVQKANFIAEREGWPQFVSVQGHYNLLHREEEREMIPFCRDAGLAFTPYSPLASGRLVKAPEETSKRLEEDAYAKGKYDATAEQDAVIVRRVAELAEKKGVSKTQIALGWLLTKSAVPVVGVTKAHHIEEAVKAVEVSLTPEEAAYLEEAYLPHKLVGVMARNQG